MGLSVLQSFPATDVAVSPRPIVRPIGKNIELEAAPIPSSWILAGDPQARAIELTPGGRGHCSSGLWSCSAGEFTWSYSADEIVHILAGEVRLRFHDHAQVAKVGDIVAFRAGTTVHWTVAEYVEKFWVLGPAPTFLSRVRRKLLG